MDAGVPIKAPVAGFLRLISDGDDWTTFIEFQGVEVVPRRDGLQGGGNQKRLTAIHDLKNDGLTPEI